MSMQHHVLARLTALLCFLAAPVTASDQVVFGTMAACRAANVPLGNTMARLDQLGWRQATRSADRSAIASHMAAGVHHTARGFDRADYRSMQQRLVKFAGKSTQDFRGSTLHLTAVFYALGRSLEHQLILWDNVVIAPGGERLTHARTCYMATPAHASVKAFAALAEPVPHLGFRRMKGQWIDPRVRRYWVRASHRPFPTSGLPFRLAATDFIRIEASTAGNN